MHASRVEHTVTMGHPYWPLFDVEVRTPRMVLRALDDDLCVELCALALRGVHDPAVMPFAIPWTDQPSPQLEREAFRFWWGCRVDARPEKWTLNLAVLVDGQVIGTSGLLTQSFPVTRSFETGSWLGRAHQGKGLGKELRMATLTLGFDGFGAEEATTAAFSDNAASLGVTRSLGYEPNGIARHERRGELAESLRFRMPRSHWEAIRRDDISLHCLDPARDFLAL
jgi:RimJ/RimL family protein N-acetyltransferase